MYTDTDIYNHIYTHAHDTLKELYLFERVQSLTNEEAWINEKVLGQSWFENCTLKLQKLWATSVKTVWRCRAAYCQAKAQNFCFFADCRFFFWMFKWDPPQVNTTAVSDACLIFEARARTFVTALYCWSCATAHLYVYWNIYIYKCAVSIGKKQFGCFPYLSISLSTSLSTSFSISFHKSFHIFPSWMICLHWLPWFWQVPLRYGAGSCWIVQSPRPPQRNKVGETASRPAVWVCWLYMDNMVNLNLLYVNLCRHC